MQYFSPAFFTPYYFALFLRSSDTGGVYFSPSFFSPFYFPAFSGRSRDGRRYFAPYFFSPFYFAPLLRDGAAFGDQPFPPYRDRDAFGAAVGALRATGAFAEVVFGSSADLRRGGSDSEPVAVITPGTWEEADEVDPSVLLRQLSFTITVIVRETEQVRGFDRMDLLACLVQNALAGNSLGGGSLPCLTRVRRGRFDPASVFPEWRLVLDCELAYLVPSPNMHACRL